jgi:hypothetical protein
MHNGTGNSDVPRCPLFELVVQVHEHRQKQLVTTQPLHCGNPPARHHSDRKNTGPERGCYTASL